MHLIFFIFSLLTCPISAEFLNQITFTQFNPSTFTNNTRPLKVAIIGAGSAGASTAYHLSLLHQPSSSLDSDGLNITIYEKSRIGGRVLSTIIKGAVVEVGASIYVRANQFMMNLTREFNISTDNPFSEVGDDKMGIWNGREFVYLQSGYSFLDKMKLLWRYGLDMFNFKKIADLFVALWSDIYIERPWKNVSKILEDIGLSHLLAVSTTSYFSEHLNPRFINEFIGAITRVNYASNPSDIHAWGGLVCGVAAFDDTFSVYAEGGNRFVFEEMVRRSRAHVAFQEALKVKYIDHHVQGKDGGGMWIVETGAGSDFYDVVVVSFPLRSGEMFDNLIDIGDVVEYVHLHVIFVVATSLSHTYFGLDSPNSLPSSILTTSDSPDDLFLSCSIVSRTPDQVIIKIFSKSPIEDAKLEEMFIGYEPESTQMFQIPAYPLLKPRSEFPNIVLDGRGLYYPNAFEAAISTMETEVISGWNVARLIYSNISII